MTPERPRPVRLLGVDYRPCPIAREQAPTLYVVVDTEAEFDWSGPFARDLTGVAATAALQRGQAVLERHGVRPIYLVDYPIATQPQGLLPLRAILARGGCEIGAHLHPWTTPPFEEAISAPTSYPGNLDPGLEERKLVCLIGAIRANLGVQPRFYKAGRYGIGPHTMATIARHGIDVDFSILPGVDLRHAHGPDFRAMQSVAYAAGDSGIVSLPMTRGHAGVLASAAGLDRMLDAKAARVLRLRGLLSALRLLDRASLTPEGVAADRQIALIRAMRRSGHRQFVLHFHSPSLAAGHTPYVRTQAAVDALLVSIDQVCRYFFGELGGRPGDPRELLPAHPHAPRQVQPAAA